MLFTQLNEILVLEHGFFISYVFDMYSNYNCEKGNKLIQNKFFFNLNEYFHDHSWLLNHKKNQCVLYIHDVRVYLFRYAFTLDLKYCPFTLVNWCYIMSCVRLCNIQSTIALLAKGMTILDRIISISRYNFDRWWNYLIDEGWNEYRNAWK